MIKKLLNSQIFLLFILIFSCFLIYSKVQPLIDNYILNKEQKQKVEELQQEIDVLNKEFADIDTKESKEKYFRQEYKMSHDGEILFSFPPETK